MQFSVIIPAKNERENIGRCLDSIFQVDWDPAQYEVIVVDNGSSDDTPLIAAQKGAKVYLQPELTISGLRNFGASMAKGEILAFMDADCTVDPSWLGEASRYLDAEEIVCFGSPPQVPPDATWVQKAWYQVRRKKEELGETAWLESMNMFVRREAFSRCRGFDEELATCEDYDISLRLKALGKVYADSRLVAYHYGEARTVAHFFRKERWRGIGNLKGVFRHGVKTGELPSVILPVLHCLALFSLPLAILLRAPLGGAPTAIVAAFFLAWQAFLLFISLARYYRKAPQHVPQIYVLLNVYYLARGMAMLRQP
ncbi:glycosyl transferase [Geoanaerobacter pelophilus]|uniref:Glycosyl transferase n=1 Tax=Geoanaerobacter pelophilus TaxID=60036 RepID=A0ABQ0MFT7_9BACT|nr:glycosyltransferase [Geoanaerobacter pelophilus]GAW65960.1 glycosyl transferase [Geoanaerobacter pelophilus]